MTPAGANSKPEGERAPPQKPRHRVLIALPFVVAGLLILALLGALLKGETARPNPLLGQPAPVAFLPPVEGLEAPGLDLAALGGGRPVLVNFFASWCAPCRLEHPLLMELAREGRIAVAGIAYKDAPADTAAFIARLGNPYAAIGSDANGRGAIDWGVAKVPESFLIGRDGRIIAHFSGPLTVSDLRRLSAIAEDETAADRR